MWLEELVPYPPRTPPRRRPHPVGAPLKNDAVKAESLRGGAWMSRDWQTAHLGGGLQTLAVHGNHSPNRWSLSIMYIHHFG